MGRSIDLRPDPVPAEFYHRRSNRHYQIRAGTMRRHQVDKTGAEVNVVEKSIHVGLGSGRNAVTFLHRTEQGRWLELPVSWYSRLNGYAMSPGYDRADHMGFRREVSGACLFCHSAGSEPAPIDCHRCHGTDEQHLKSPVKGTILNPRSLAPERQLDVCLQCHLETTSRGIQDHLLAPGRTLWSFRPGERLTDYKMYFDRKDSDTTDRFEFNHTGYRLLQSACYQKSGGKLTCTTCHDPHSAEVRPNACAQCHTQVHANENVAADRSCSSCHMRRRVPVDAIHTSVVDHKIVSRPVFNNPAGEDHRPYTGLVVPFYGKADALSLAIANAAGKDDIRIFEQHLKRAPNDVSALTALGKALLRVQRASDAIPLFQRALKADPLHTESRMHLGVALALTGKLNDSLAELRRAVADNPDHTLSWINLGATLAAAGERKEARRAYSEAIRLQPDSQEARHRLRLLE